MTIHFNLHRFGIDELAVGHLINGTFPADDQQRWAIIEAPHYRINKLLQEHLSAQAALRECRDVGRPFVLFLRSFSTEHQGKRAGGNISSIVSTHSLSVQKWVQQRIRNTFPLIKLHGGSDASLSTTEGDTGNVLSTHAANWEAVAAELVQAASAIIFLVSDLSVGVSKEFDIIRACSQMHRCLVVIADRGAMGPADLFTLRARLSDFPNRVELQLPGHGDPQYPASMEAMFFGLFQQAGTQAKLERSLAAPFSYLEPSFVDSEDYTWTETHIWDNIRNLRVTLDDTYWAGLKANGVPFGHLDLAECWQRAHQVYGLAIATADFNAIQEVLSHLRLLYLFRGADMALAFPWLAQKYRALAAQLFPSGTADTESRYTKYVDPLKIAATLGHVRDFLALAAAAASRDDAEVANYFYQAGLICALRSNEGESRRAAAAAARDWAAFQTTSTLREWAHVNEALAASLSRQ